MHDPNPPLDQLLEEEVAERERLFLQQERERQEQLAAIIQGHDKRLPHFHLLNEFQEATKELYEQDHEIQEQAYKIKRLADLVIPNLDTRSYTGMPERLQANARVLVTGSLAIVIEGFEKTTNKNGTPGPKLMANKEHYLIDHSLHTARILAELMPHAPLGSLIAALFHDYFEDVPKAALKERLGEDAGPEDFYGRIREQLTLGLAPELKDEIAYAMDAVKRLTMRRGEDYFSNIETIIEETATQEPAHEREQRVIRYALLAKLTDKISAVQTIEPFSRDKKLRTYGKTWKVINVAREYLARHTGEKDELLQTIKELTVQASIAAAKSAKAERERHREKTPLTKTFETNDELHDEYLLAGGFNSIDVEETEESRAVAKEAERRTRNQYQAPQIKKGEDSPSYQHRIDKHLRTEILHAIHEARKEKGLPPIGSYEMEKYFPTFSRTLEASKVLGMQLEYEGAIVAPQWQRPGESNEETRERLYKRQCAYREEVISGEDATMKYDRRLLAFNTLFSKMAVHTDFRLEGL